VQVSEPMARALLTALSLLLIFGISATFGCEESVIIGDVNSGLGGDKGNERDAIPSPPERLRFSTPRLIAELSSPDSKEQDPTISGDLLEIFFYSDRSGDDEIWTSRRATPDSLWEQPTQVLALTSPGRDINPAISVDGLRLWFHSQREPSGIWFSERETRDSAWTSPVRIDPLGSEIAPGPSQDELRMGVSVLLDDRDGRDIFEAVRPDARAPWGEPTELAGINDLSDDSTPFLIGDGQQILFSSSRTGQGDLFWAHREIVNAPVTTIEALVELNDPDAFDSHPVLSVDGTLIFFGSTRSGNTDLYQAEIIMP
jgi:hypothetical protein